MTQRVIKYRAWDGERMYISPSSSDGLQHLASWFEAHSIFGPGRTKESIIMTWTGLLDKHGKEIYEGDLLVIDDDKEHPVLVVFGTYSLGKDSWGINHTTMGFFLKYPDGSGYNGLHNMDSKLRDESHYGFAGCEVEIIGNIYTNPELVDPKMIENGNS